MHFTGKLSRDVPGQPHMTAGAVVTSDPAAWSPAPVAGEPVFQDAATCAALEKKGYFEAEPKESRGKRTARRPNASRRLEKTGEEE